MNILRSLQNNRQFSPTHYTSLRFGENRAITQPTSLTHLLCFSTHACVSHHIWSSWLGVYRKIPHAYMQIEIIYGTKRKTLHEYHISSQPAQWDEVRCACRSYIAICGSCHQSCEIPSVPPNRHLASGPSLYMLYKQQNLFTCRALPPHPPNFITRARESFFNNISLCCHKARNNTKEFSAWRAHSICSSLALTRCLYIWALMFWRHEYAKANIRDAKKGMGKAQTF